MPSVVWVTRWQGWGGWGQAVRRKGDFAQATWPTWPQGLGLFPEQPSGLTPAPTSPFTGSERPIHLLSFSYSFAHMFVHLLIRLFDTYGGEVVRTDPDNPGQSGSIQDQPGQERHVFSSWVAQ